MIYNLPINLSIRNRAETCTNSHSFCLPEACVFFEGVWRGQAMLLALVLMIDYNDSNTGFRIVFIA